MSNSSSRPCRPFLNSTRPLPRYRPISGNRLPKSSTPTIRRRINCPGLIKLANRKFMVVPLFTGKAVSFGLAVGQNNSNPWQKKQPARDKADDHLPRAQKAVGKLMAVLPFFRQFREASFRPCVEPLQLYASLGGSTMRNGKYQGSG